MKRRIECALAYVACFAIALVLGISCGNWVEEQENSNPPTPAQPVERTFLKCAYDTKYDVSVLYFFVTGRYIDGAVAEFYPGDICTNARNQSSMAD